MRRKHLFLAVAIVLAAGGLWFAGSTWRAGAIRESSLDANSDAPPRPPTPGQDQPLHASGVDTGPESQTGTNPPRPMLRPPEPNRRFMDFTPEQRVEFARRGHGPGG